MVAEQAQRFGVIVTSTGKYALESVVLLIWIISFFFFSFELFLMNTLCSLSVDEMESIFQFIFLIIPR